MELQHFGYCPQCLKTGYWQSDETKEMIICEWCDRTFVYDDEIDKFMDTDTNEIVKRKASDEAESKVAKSRKRKKQTKTCSVFP